MKIYFCGTNGWFNTETGETVCTLIDCKDAYIVLDAGNGIRKIDRFITDPNKPILLFLSHFHLDHTEGLHILAKFNFPQGIDIIGQPGTKDILAKLLVKPFTAEPSYLASRLSLRIHNLKEGENLVSTIKVQALPLVHADPCYGYSFQIEGKKIAYCTDTGICENYFKLAENANMLITECSWMERNQYSKWPHLAPEDSAEAALKSKVKELVLTHFDAKNYSTYKLRGEAEARAKRIFPNTIGAKDNMTLEL